MNLSNKGKVFLAILVAAVSIGVTSGLASLYRTSIDQICESNDSTPKTTISGNFAVDNKAVFNSDASLTSSGKYVYVVWVNNTNGHCDLLFTRSINNGKSFENVTSLNDKSEGPPINPHVTASDNNLYIMWSTTKKTGSAEFFTSSTNNGLSFQKIIKMNNTSADHVK